MREFEPLSPACMKCEQVTGKSTCFPGPCVFYHERNTLGTKSANIAALDRVRRGMRDSVHVATPSIDPGLSGKEK